VDVITAYNYQTATVILISVCIKALDYSLRNSRIVYPSLLIICLSNHHPYVNILLYIYIHQDINISLSLNDRVGTPWNNYSEHSASSDTIFDKISEPSTIYCSHPQTKTFKEASTQTNPINASAIWTCCPNCANYNVVHRAFIYCIKCAKYY